MPIIGPFPDGGYELWCAECGSKITCFGLEEIFIPIKSSVEQFKIYDNFICSDCLPILNAQDINISDDIFDKERFSMLLQNFIINN